MHVCTISNISSGHKGGNGNGAVVVLLKKDCHNKPVGYKTFIPLTKNKTPKQKTNFIKNKI